MTEPALQVGVAVALVRAGAQAFAEANPWRARKVRADARLLLGEVGQREGDLLGAWPGAANAAGLVLAPRIEGMARAADQLAALAEGRSSPRFRDPLAEAFDRQQLAVGLVLDAVDSGDVSGLGDALDDVRRYRQELVKSCLTVAVGTTRSFTQSLLAASAAMRLEEAAEHAADLARVLEKA